MIFLRYIIRIIEESEKEGYVLIIIADHGNAEFMINNDGSPNTAHIWLDRSTEICNFGHKWGPHGSPRTHIKPGRSHKPQEGF